MKEKEKPWNELTHEEKMRYLERKTEPKKEMDTKDNMDRKCPNCGSEETWEHDPEMGELHICKCGQEFYPKERK